MFQRFNQLRLKKSVSAYFQAQNAMHRSSENVISIAFDLWRTWPARGL